MSEEKTRRVAMALSAVHCAAQDVIRMYEDQLRSLERDKELLVTIKCKAYEACVTGDEETMRKCISLCDSFDLPIWKRGVE